ncbi:MAG TPA: CPBP family glutamic-type intramembrane protease [Verrucomicrobiales bacterium]|jgi:membrane protease YdiL (CAAX protease family)|nr:CPBP family glutamic-type intramembrane protease [Verrucomicrobiales bacterium]
MSHALQPLIPPHPCSYCGQELRADSYFCPSCSKPWRSGEIGLGPAPEPVWDDETRIRKKAPEVYHLFFCYLVAVLMAAVVSVMAWNNTRDFLSLYVLSGIAVLGVTLYGAQKHWDVLQPNLKRPGINQPAFFLGLLMGVVLLGINFAWHGLLEGWLREGTGSKSISSEAFGRGISLPSAFFLLCFIPAITEEIGFRGLMQTILLRALTPKKAIFVSSLLFATAHFNLFGFPYLFLVGVVLGWLLHKTGSVYPGMIIHAAHNLVVVYLANS